MSRSAPASPSQIGLSSGTVTPDGLSREGSPIPDVYSNLEASGDGYHVLGQPQPVVHRLTQVASQDVRLNQSAPVSPAGNVAL